MTSGCNSTAKERSTDPAQEAQDLKTAQQDIDSSQPENVFNIVKNYQDQINDKTENGKKWLDLLIKASIETQNFPQLAVLFDKFPKAFTNNEEAALILANGYLIAHRTEEYDRIRAQWKGHESHSKEWVLLDSDRLLLEGKRPQAIEMLKSQTTTGKTESKRLIRLALITLPQNPRESWNYLTQAAKIDPSNPDIPTYRGRILEAIGKTELAENEYVIAAQIEPKNYFLKDQLAEFYMRTKQYPKAMETWTKALSPTGLDYLWVKTFFWNRVITPVKFDWNESKNLENTPLKPYILYLTSLPKGMFWDKAAFEKLPDHTLYLQTQQSSFWLRLLQALKEGNENEAWNILQDNPFREISWNPQLELALKRILIFRRVKTFNIDHLTTVSPTADSGEQPLFFKQLEDLTKQAQTSPQNKLIPDDLRELLESSEVFTAAFLSVGWMEAALQLNQQTIIPDGFPQWVAYDLTQALRVNDGNLEALRFATIQKETPTLSLLIGELYIASNSPDAALAQLKQIVNDSSNIGYRASWLVSLLYIEKGDYKAAEEAIKNNARLAQDVLGKETLARIALLEGNTEQADKMYSSIEKQSAEAKSYLARKAFNDQDWAKARELTEELLKDNPNNPVLQDNLKKIIEEEKNSVHK